MSLTPDRHPVQGARIGQQVQLALPLFGVGQNGLAVDVDPGLQGFQGVGAGQKRFGDVHGADSRGRGSGWPFGRR